ncbi:MAG: hypothetical protein HYU57_01420 [Micavibrio aeruginosavorus]|nr:hypothetical protein [Micavibrio aeruginosavorus]
MSKLIENAPPPLGRELDYLDILQNFPDFLNAVDKSYAEYEEKIKLGFRSLEYSSRELNVSNRRLEILNENINAMLDSLGQGLVFFDRQGIFSQIYSKACATLFDTMPGGRSVSDVLNFDASQKEDFVLWLSLVFSPESALSFDDMAGLAPDSFINRRGRDIHLEYRPVRSASGEISGVLLIATDRTQEKRAQEELEATQSLSRFIVRAAQNRNEFTNFIRNMRSFVTDHAICKTRDIVEILREMHTYKGLAFHFGLERLGNILNQAESEIGQGKNISGDDVAAGFFKEIERELEDAIRHGENLLGRDFLDRGQVRMVEYKKLCALRDRLRRLPAAEKDDLLAFIDSEIMAVPIRECFSTFEAELARIAETQGKPAPHVYYNTIISALPLGDYGEFFESLVHLARNIMSHGIEDQALRRAAGKADRGCVRVRIEKCKNMATGGQEYMFEFEDDGRGFDMALLRQRLSDTNPSFMVEQMTDDQVLQFVFQSQFSSQASASTLAGRGMGMYAIRRAVEQAGGRFRADSGQPGARFSFVLPVRSPS